MFKEESPTKNKVVNERIPRTTLQRADTSHMNVHIDIEMLDFEEAIELSVYDRLSQKHFNESCWYFS